MSPYLAGGILCGVRIKLFTLVASANAKPGQLILPCGTWTETPQFLSIEPVFVGGFYPAKLGHLCRKSNPGLPSCWSFPATCQHSTAFRGV